MNADEERLETPKQLAARVGVKERHIRHLINTRQIEHVRIGSRVHIPFGAFARFVARRRCIVPIDGFFEWRAIRGARAKQPYAIAMSDGSPFGLAGLWENWRNPTTCEWERTFVVITTPSNDLVGQIHDRMPAILTPTAYDRWLGPEPNPHDLLITYSSEPMTMWPITTRVNAPENDDPSLLDRVDEVAFDQKDLMRVSTVG